MPLINVLSNSLIAGIELVSIKYIEHAVARTITKTHDLRRTIYAENQLVSHTGGNDIAPGAYGSMQYGTSSQASTAGTGSTFHPFRLRHVSQDD
jgi:hypothetical protein